MLRLLKSIEVYDSVIVVMDQFNEKGTLLPTTTAASASQTAQLFFDKVWEYYDLPIKIVSDRDSTFTSKFWKILWSLLGIELAMSIAYPSNKWSNQKVK